MTDPAPTLRLALDQNFPTPLIGAVTDYLPVDIEIKSLHRIDPRLSELDDRTLFLALHHLGWHGLVTNNCKMLDLPAELAAIVPAQAVVVAVEGLGHDPLPAVGAAGWSSPWPVESSLATPVECVFVSPTAAGWLRMHARVFSRSLDGEGVTNELRQEVLVSDEEFARTRLTRWGEQLRAALLELQATSHPELTKLRRRSTRDLPTPAQQIGAPATGGAGCDRPRHSPALGIAGRRVIHKPGAFRVDRGPLWLDGVPICTRGEVSGRTAGEYRHRGRHTPTPIASHSQAALGVHCTADDLSAGPDTNTPIREGPQPGQKGTRSWTNPRGSLPTTGCCFGSKKLRSGWASVDR